MSLNKIYIDANNMVLRTDYDVSIVKQINEHLLDCEITFEEDKIVFHCDFDQNFLLSNYHLSLEEKYILLLNVAKLAELDSFLNFKLSKDNLYVDYNFDVKVIIRDIKGNNNNYSFVDKFKACIGSVLNSQYTYDDYLNGGLDLLNKSSLTSKYYNLNNLNDIINTLIKDLEDESNAKKYEYRDIKNSVYKRNKWIFIIVSILLVISVGCGLVLTNNLNKTKGISDVKTYYINNEYSKVIDYLSSKNVNKLSQEILYIGAVSSINLEKIDQSSKDNILSQINYNTDPNILKYWVYIGIGQYQKAQEIAYEVNDKDYLAYSYLKELEYIRTDTNLTTEEKESRVRDLETKIEELGFKLNNK